ncbi:MULTISPECIES: hypothetical protein [unclassified Streptomyces]|uniref:hypothetical protein n=1 Tax=unclassified Streptomyces TaxID=2593676 RepID=UPI000FB138F6|nr:MULTISPECIES: hypothetical protein [unclassified Streptomyces]MCX4772723.1 hypothetical protein [Streptomyces sp. NBC_01285]ROQ71303.1 hypothetical protein EDD95_7404 [Streptomyces sp. CEV 2-1]
MRSPARLVTGTAAAALAAAAFGLCAAAPSAYGEELGPLEITPASAAPGTTVTVNTKACGGDTGATGDASSLDASRFALAPATLKEVLAGSFRVPGNVEPGPYSIDVACENGKRATGEIKVKAAGTTGRDDADPAGTAGRSSADPTGTTGRESTDPTGAAGRDTADPTGTAGRSTPDPTGTTGRESTDPTGAAGRDTADPTGTAGRSTPDPTGTTGRDSTGAARTDTAPDGSEKASPADSSDSSARDSSSFDSLGRDEAEADGSALVPDAPTAPGRDTSGERPSQAEPESSAAQESSSDFETSSGHRTSAAPTAPTGHVRAGVGGSVGPDTTQITAGAGVLAATAVGGAWLLRRRASGTQDDS